MLLNGKATLSADGTLLAAGTSVGEVQLWDTSDPRRPELASRLTASDTLIQQVAFTTDHSLLAVAADDARVTLWDLADPSEPVEAGYPRRRSGPSVGRRVLPGRHHAGRRQRRPGRLRLRRQRPGESGAGCGADRLRELRARSRVLTTGKTAAVASDDELVRLYDLHDPSQPALVGKPLSGPNGYVYSVTFSDDGHTVAAAADGAAWVWDVTDPDEARADGDPAARRRRSVATVAASPVDGTLVAGGSERRVFSWDTDPDAVADRTCLLAGAAITPDEWARYVPAQEFSAPCASRE